MMKKLIVAASLLLGACRAEKPPAPPIDVICLNYDTHHIYDGQYYQDVKEPYIEIVGEYGVTRRIDQSNIKDWRCLEVEKVDAAPVSQT